MFVRGDRLETVPMTPDGTVSWDSFDVPDADGKLYLAPPHRGRTAKLILSQLAKGLPNHCLSQKHDDEYGEPLGGVSRLRRISGMALKVFDDDLTADREPYEIPLTGGLPAVRANVILHEGLKRVRGLMPAGLHVSAPAFYGAFIPNDFERVVPDRNAQVVFAMSYERGYHVKDLNDIMPGTEREALYVQAAAACGVDNPDAIDLDNDITHNTLVTDGGHRMIKLDVTAGLPLYAYFNDQGPSAAL